MTELEKRAVALAKAVRRYERAHIEHRRAVAAGTQPRQKNAGDRLAIARWGMFGELQLFNTWKAGQ